VSIDHYENFPVASLLCPPRLRPAVLAIYRFARTADDLADEGDFAPSQRLELLGAYRADLLAIAAGRSPRARWQPVFDDLATTLRDFALPVQPLHQLLDAFEQDVHNPVYADRDDLLAYCAKSANPVGRLLLHLYRIDEDASLRQSDAICSALQLINFWQDLSIDLARGRNYVPLSDMQRHGVGEAELLARRDSPGARTLVRELVQWPRTLMAAGAPLVRRVPGRAGWELRLVVQGGLRILEKIERMHHDSLRHRPRLRPTDAPLLLLRALR
jgi:squalene synthase HpnC